MPTNGQGQISGPSSPPQPQTPPPGPAGGTTSGTTSSASPSPIDETLKIFREWLRLENDIPVLAVLGTVAANMLPGDPVWLGLVAPPSSAKTEILITLAKVPNVELVGTLTPAGLLSGTPRRQHAPGARGGLLQKIGAFGFIVLKDFTSILSMRPESKGEILGALREIYDGRWSRAVGADGGRILSWSGKIGLLFGCTKVIDNQHTFIQQLGERFLYCRLKPDPDQFLHATKHIGMKTKQMRKQLTEAVADLFAVPLRTPQELTDKERYKINDDIKLAVRLRGAVDRDRYTRELEDATGAEGTGRLGLTLERLLAGLDSLGIERAAAFAVIEKVTFDSVPPNRLRVYEHLKEIDPSWADTSTIAHAIRLPTTTVRRALEDLVAYDLAEKQSVGQGNPTLWRVL